MIINTGGRTDTVNYYSDWLLNRFEEGFVYSRNPLFPNHITKYTLDPSVVDCVVFCSKNYRPILSELHRITDRFNVFCHYTITAYGKDVEPNVPDIDQSIDACRTLCKSRKQMRCMALRPCTADLEIHSGLPSENVRLHGFTPCTVCELLCIQFRGNVQEARIQYAGTDSADR